MQRSYISLTWTPGVDPEDAQLFIRTIEDIYAVLRPHLGKPGQFDPLPVVRVFGSWAMTGVPREAAYSSIEWYISHSLDDGGKHILASRYLNTVRMEPWQSTSPHFDFALTETRIVNDIPGQASESEALGFNQPGLVSLITSFPFEAISSPDLRRMALRHTYAHFFGRLLEAPRYNRAETLIHKGDLYCTNTCAMRFTDTPTLALSFARQETETGALFCPACQKDIVASITGFHYGVN